MIIALVKCHVASTHMNCEWKYKLVHLSAKSLVDIY